MSEGWLGGDFWVAFMVFSGVVCWCDFGGGFGCGFGRDFGVVFLGVVLVPDLGLRGGGFGGLLLLSGLRAVRGYRRPPRRPAHAGAKPFAFIARPTSSEVRGRKTIYLFYPS